MVATEPTEPPESETEMTARSRKAKRTRADTQWKPVAVELSSADLDMVNEWANGIKVESTRRAYRSLLLAYYDVALRTKYGSLRAYLEKVRNDFKTGEWDNEKYAWAAELQKHADTYVSPLRNRHFVSSTKNQIASAVRSFIKKYVNTAASTWKFDFKETSEERLSKQDQVPMKEEEVRSLYQHAQTLRDKALVLVAVNGVAVNELEQVFSRWERWFKPDMTAPYQIPALREKAGVWYHVTLFEDAVESVRNLYNERLLQEGDLKGKALFANDETRATMTTNTISEAFNRLRDRANLTERKGSEKYVLQRVHPHAFRHFFKSQATEHKVMDTASEYALGHALDKYGYARVGKKDKGDTAIKEEWRLVLNEELGKMRDILNIASGKVMKMTETKEKELLRQGAKIAYNTLFETGQLKPEALSQQMLRTILEKLGIEVDPAKIAYLADDVNLPAEIQRRVGMFDILAKELDLSTETWSKYMEALKVLRPGTATAKWENHTDFYIRCEVGSDDYMTALTDGYKPFDQDGKMRILTKPKDKPGKP